MDRLAAGVVWCFGEGTAVAVAWAVARMGVGSGVGLVVRGCRVRWWVPWRNSPGWGCGSGVLGGEFGEQFGEGCPLVVGEG